MSDNKINIIFCDEKHNPFGQMSSYYLKHNSSKQIYKQIKWTKTKKESLWREIIKNKILNQYLLVKKLKSSNYKLLKSYIDEVKDNDKTNREGHAAKVYFNSLFGKTFIRHNNDNINSALNYGYSILLSTISKEISVCGYLSQLGIHHKNEFNEFNLACDFMEPFRIVIDSFVYYNIKRDFDTNYKMDLVNIFNNKFIYNKKSYTLKDIISKHVKNCFDYLELDKEYENFIIYDKG